MTMKPLVGLGVSLLLSVLCPALASNPQESDAKEVYAGLPVEVHLLIADLKLDELVQGADSGREAAKARTLRESKALLKEALRKYEYFRTGDKKILSEGWGFSWAPPRPDFPSVGKSPLSLLEHLWIGYDMAAQLRSSIMIAPVQYSPDQAELHKSLDDSVGLMEKTIQAVESTGVWIVHWLSGARLMISAPPEFKPTTLMKSDLVRLLKPKPDGSAQGVVFVSQAYLDREEMDGTPEQYREKIIEKLRQRFPDMSGVELGESRAATGSFTTSFSYQYTWEGDVVKALVHIRRIGNTAYEVNYVSVAESFDRKEADRIIQSFLKR
ncbi:MAG: hypothetical protein MUQ00_02875 [Candidatus Aminicenantes bacterium]|nr:hypothetical protein [Candidatus Aminicenantes bacterium]